jgi:Protein of unknown function (DUF642)
MTTEPNANLIVNGSFELFDQATSVNKGTWWGVRNLPGWTLEGVAKDSTNWFEVVNSGTRGVVSDRGTHWLDMDASNGNIAMYQNVEGAEAGHQYTLSVRLASSGSGDGVDVYWGGVKLANIVPTSAVMDTYTFTVTASGDASHDILRLAGTGATNGTGVSVDDVSLVREPDGFYAPDDATFYISGVHEGTADAQSFEMGRGAGRHFINNFDITEDHIRIRADLATSWADLKSKATIYQSEGSTVVEFHNDSEVLVLTQFDSTKLGSSSFVFDAKPLTTATVTGANLIRNGSFETVGAATKMTWGLGATALDGWTLAGAAKTGTNWFELAKSGVRDVTAAEGKYWLDMDASSGNIGISQAVAGIEEGRYYTVSFSAASSKAGNLVDVFWAGEKIGTVTPDGTAMQTFSFVVEGSASTALNQLSFKGVGTADGYGVSLDNVQMFAHQGIVAQPDVFTFGLGSGRLYVTDFQVGFDRIEIKGDLFASFEQLMQNAAVYQDGGTTIVEINNGREMIILPQFDQSRLTAEMFTFVKSERSTEFQAISKTLTGTDKDDTLIAGAGDQTIDGGAGFDILTGGVGADTFIYNTKSGHDFITDFNGAEDHILISSEIAKSFDHLLEVGAIYQDGNSTQIEMGEGQLITLFGVQAKNVTADWFVF